MIITLFYRVIKILMFRLWSIILRKVFKMFKKVISIAKVVAIQVGINSAFSAVDEVVRAHIRERVKSRYDKKRIKVEEMH